MTSIEVKFATALLCGHSRENLTKGNLHRTDEGDCVVCLLHEENERLSARVEEQDRTLASLAERLVEEENELEQERGVLSMTVRRLGGIVEGATTGRHNFLQRIDELRATETELAELATLREQLVAMTRERNAAQERCARYVEAIDSARKSESALHETTRVRDARTEPPAENDEVLAYVDDWRVVLKTGTHWMMLDRSYGAISKWPFWIPLPPAAPEAP